MTSMPVAPGPTDVASARQQSARITGVLEGFRDRLNAQSRAVGFLMVFIPLLAVYLVTANNSFRQANDTIAVAVPAHRFASAGDFTLDSYESGNPWFIPADGRVVSNRFPGAIFLAIPFYRLLGDPSAFSTGPGAIASATIAAGAMGILYLLFRRLVPPSAAMAGAFVSGLATSTWTISADALWTHGPGQLWLAAAILALASKSFVLSGVGFGLTIFTRPHTAVIAAVAGLHHSWHARSIRPAAAIAAMSSIGLLAFLAYSQVMFSTTLPDGGYGASRIQSVAHMGIARFGENLAGTLVAPSRGILVLSPFLLMLLPGLRRAWGESPVWVRSAALGGVTYMLVQLRGNHFDGGEDFFAYRLPLEMLTAAAPLLLVSYQQWVSRARWRMQSFWTLVGVSLVVQFVGAVIFIGDRASGPVRWSPDEVWGTFLDMGWIGLVSLAASVLFWTFGCHVVLRRRVERPRGAAAGVVAGVVD